MTAALLTVAPVQGHLALAVHEGERRNGPTLANTTLTCAPGAGGHCRELARAGGDIGKIPNHNGICPMLYAPVTVTATGTWGGHAVSYLRTYGNRCIANGAAGGLFHF